MHILVLNCGSSSIKYQLFNMPEGSVLADGSISRIGTAESIVYQKTNRGDLSKQQPIENHQQGLDLITGLLTDSSTGALSDLKTIDACGHRVVHGGESMTASVLIDSTVEKVIEQHAELAPLHNPANLLGIQAVRKTLGNIPMVACFDTAFHQTLPERAYLYALPYDYYKKHKIRRYGFHGTSHHFVTQRAAEKLKIDIDRINLITCHLGNGCSITAVQEGKSIDTSMGFTPLEGLVMGTRTGSFDPAIIFYLTKLGYTKHEIEYVINRQSGLLGISGISNDVRDLEEKSHQGFKRACIALELFAYQVRKQIGAYLAILPGSHAIVFTGGIGENGHAMRRRILSGMDFFGIKLDNARNESACGIEADIASDKSMIRLLVIPTNEELMLARETVRVVKEQDVKRTKRQRN